MWLQNVAISTNSKDEMLYNIVRVLIHVAVSTTPHVNNASYSSKSYISQAQFTAQFLMTFLIPSKILFRKGRYFMKKYFGILVVNLYWPQIMIKGINYPQHKQPWRRADWLLWSELLKSFLRLSDRLCKTLGCRGSCRSCRLLNSMFPWLDGHCGFAWLTMTKARKHKNWKKNI